MEWIGEVDGSVNAAYNDDFRVWQLRVNGADPVTFGYDGDGLLTQAGALNAGRDAASGQLTGTTLGGVTSAQSYSGFGELAGLTWSHSWANLLTTSYTRDALGRIETKTETSGGVTTTWTYSYDLAGRLTEVERDGTSVEAYTYDANGNRTTLTGSGGAIAATYDVQDRLLTYGSNSYTYTANGELTSKTQGADVTTYTYDPLGNLLAVDLPDGTEIDYVVDPLGRRIGRKVGGVLQQGWLYQDGLNPIAELDATGSVVSRFVYGTRSNVPDYMVRGGTTYRIVSDELGSVRLVVDVGTGAVAQELAYDAWGRVLVDTNPGFQPFGYAGGLYDPLTGLVRFGARDYDAEVGRWTAKDPIGFGGGDGNLYAYVSGDPTNLIDSHGLSEVSAACIFAVTAFALSAGGDPFFTLKLLRGLPTMARYLVQFLNSINRGGLVSRGDELYRIAGRAGDWTRASDAMDGLTQELVDDATTWGKADVLGEGFGTASELSAGKLPSLWEFLLGLIPIYGSKLAFDEMIEACSTPEGCTSSGPGT